MAYTITPLTENTGAEVRGLDLTKPVDPETRVALNRAFAQHHVLVVRDQTYEPLEPPGAAQGDDPLPGGAADERRRHAVRQHARRL
jgi:alpha-ketoglutarate-dependent taurine dioxygenase